MTTQIANLISLKGEIEEKSKRALEIKVKDAETFNEATNLYAYARECQKQIEEALKAAQKPFKQKIAELKEQAKALTDPLDAIIERTNAETQAYSIFLEHQAEAAAFFSLGETTTVATSLGEGATLIKKVERRFRIVSEAEVPRQFLKPDEDKIATHVKLGVDNIPGVEIYEETVTSLRRK